VGAREVGERGEVDENGERLLRNHGLRFVWRVCKDADGLAESRFARRRPETCAVWSGDSGRLMGTLGGYDQTLNTIASGEGSVASASFANLLESRTSAPEFLLAESPAF